MQDFTPVIIGNRSQQAGKQSNSREKKGTKSTGLSGKLDNQEAAKLDGDEAKAPLVMGTHVGRAIVAARTSKKWKAEDLARQMSLTKNVILEIESGKHKRDNKLLQRLEKKLGVWLTGEPDRIGKAKDAEARETETESKEAVCADKKVKTTAAAATGLGDQ